MVNPAETAGLGFGWMLRGATYNQDLSTGASGKETWRHPRRKRVVCPTLSSRTVSGRTGAGWHRTASRGGLCPLLLQCAVWSSVFETKPPPA